MNDILRGEDVAKRVLGASQGAYAKHLSRSTRQVIHGLTIF